MIAQTLARLAHLRDVPQMGTLIDWSQLRARMESYRRLYGYESDHLALAHVVLEQEHNLPPEEVQDAVTDGPQDRGVDAVWIDEDGPTVHLYQVKTVATFEKAGNNFPSNEIDKIQSYLADMLQKADTLRQAVNPLLWEKTLSIWTAFEQSTPSLVVHFCGNMEPLTPDNRDRLTEVLGRYRIGFVEHTLSSLARDLIIRAAPRLNRKLQVVDNQYFERVDGNIRGLVATVEATALIEMIRDPDNDQAVLPAIFDDNVRVYLTQRNEINRKIAESAKSEQNAEFWYLNNGITMTCDTLQYPPGVRAPTIDLTNVQIVNGGQTSNALFEAYRQDPARVRNVVLLVRIYETRAREISQLIAETTNSQTPVRSRDLRANEEIQKRLEDAFLYLGYFYERKANQHRQQPTEKRIDALVAGRAYVAYYLNQPDVAKRDQRRIFGDMYTSIFNDTVTPDRLLTPVLVFTHISALKNQLRSDISKGRPYDGSHLVLIDGTYQILNACRFILEGSGRDEDDPGAGLEVVDTAIAVVARLAKSEADEDPAFSYSRFFKDKRTTKKVHGAIRDHLKQVPLPTGE